MSAAVEKAIAERLAKKKAAAKPKKPKTEKAAS